MAEQKRPESQHDQWQRELAASLRKAGEQLALGIAKEAVARATNFAEGAHKRHVLEQHTKEELRQDRERHRLARRLEKQRLRREAQLGKSSRVEGYAYGLIAGVMIVMAILQPQVWWLIFVALGLGLQAARIIGYHSAQAARSLPTTEPILTAASVRDPREIRIDEVCDKLKAALKEAPTAVRDFLSKPEETVESLRKTSLDLLKRELSLRALVNADETTRLKRERLALQSRIEMEPDDIIRNRLEGALEALVHQQEQYTEVLKSANRLEAERTRLGYTLEGLYAQVMRVRTADAGSSEIVSAGLRLSLDQLREEVGALAEALEEVNRAPVPTEGFAARVRVR